MDYEVSNYGRVRRYLRPFTVGAHPYPQVYLSGRNRVHVHRLVAALFIGEQKAGLVVNHKDSNPQNNWHENLEYVTHLENIRKASRITKLTADDVRRIRMLSRNLGLSHREIAKQYPVGDHQICMIVKRRAWRDLE